MTVRTRKIAEYLDTAIKFESRGFAQGSEVALRHAALWEAMSDAEAVAEDHRLREAARDRQRG